jgi:hypothetical protein
METFHLLLSADAATDVVSLPPEGRVSDEVTRWWRGLTPGTGRATPEKSEETPGGACADQPFSDESVLFMTGAYHIWPAGRPEHHLLSGGSGTSSWWSPTKVAAQHSSHPATDEQRLGERHSRSRPSLADPPKFGRPSGIEKVPIFAEDPAQNGQFAVEHAPLEVGLGSEVLCVVGALDAAAARFTHGLHVVQRALVPDEVE